MRISFASLSLLVTLLYLGLLVHNHLLLLEENEAPVASVRLQPPQRNRGINTESLHVVPETRRHQPAMKLKMIWNPTDNRPPYRSVMALNGTIIGDVSNILNFAVIGFGKCGTSTIQDWLQLHPQIQCYPKEVYSMYKNQPHEVVHKMYYLPNSEDVNVRRGYKSPADLCFPHVMPYFRRYFPKTVLIVGIRHPVLWFQVSNVHSSRFWSCFGLLTSNAQSLYNVSSAASHAYGIDLNFPNFSW